ncbi:MAG: hypothetical protein KF851_10945 [Pirellulaceae bacterium]|jgi:uncharacterized repeat protein (TIGR04138 family)|nr:hypothetical protein [Pirellulaceae bacterium]
MDPDLYALVQLLRSDTKYSLEAYLFVREGLAYAADHIALENVAEPTSMVATAQAVRSKQKHVSGQELCEGIRQYALNQFGFMAKIVLNSWGLQSTSDIGEVVYKMIEIGLLKKSSRDRRSHFDDVFDFEAAFVEEFDFAADCSPCRRP